MVHAISADKINHIQRLRRKGYSLPEIQKEVHVGYGTVYRYIQGVKISLLYKKTWFGKRGGSIKRKKLAEIYAQTRAEKLIPSMTKNEILMFFSALYWSEGSKADFNVINSDPILIAVIVKTLLKILEIDRSRIRLSIRIHEDVNESDALSYWSKLTEIPIENFSATEVLKGKKRGKLLHGMCRVRVRKGADLLKYMKAVYKRVAENILSP